MEALSMISLNRFAFLVSPLIVLASVGCTVTPTPITSTSSGDSGAPVKQEVLAGTINGASFTAVSAIETSIGGLTSVTVYDSAVTCASIPPEVAVGHPQILLDVDPWTSGAAYELGLAQTVTFLFLQSDGTLFDDIVTSGRVEVTTAATLAPDGGTGTAGVIGIRANDPQYGSIEGQVPVIACPL
jgi:hypothetical protein